VRNSAQGVTPSAVEGLIGVTRAMIEKTRTAEEDLRRSGEEVARLRRSLAEARRTADTDPLTGLPNRRALDVRLREAFAAARASGRKLSLAICDIDQFKAVNDLHGHHIGDEVIKFIAGALSRGDVERLFVARYGGEEFVMLFEGMDTQAAADEIDRIRREIANHSFKVTATGRDLGRLTFSAGIAGLAGRRGPGAILKNADAALYRAKQEGRNRVCIAP
jgi:diguanylate cyclase